MSVWVIIFCALIWFPAYFYAEHKQKELEEEERRKAQEAAEAARCYKEWAKGEERRAKERKKESERRAKEEAKAAQRAAERAERAEYNKPQIEDLARVLEAKTNLAIALERAAANENDPVKKATLHERAARIYAQAHSISDKIDKLMEGRI